MTGNSGNTSQPLADDIIRGADAVAVEIYGTPKMRGAVYRLADAGNLPVFRLGSQICARRSVLKRFIEEQERANSRESA